MKDSFQDLMRLWLKEYSSKPENESNAEWLAKQLKKNVPELSAEESSSSATDIVSTIDIYNAKRESLRAAESRGMSREGWLSRELENSAQGMSTVKYGEYLSGIDTAIAEANNDLTRVIFTKNGEVNQNPNLFGYIAEAEHAGTFNMDAALKNKDVKAQVLFPEPGKGYAKDSADIAVLNKDGNQAQLVQSKYYLDAEASNAAFEKGDYSGQERLVPDGHGKDGVSQDHLSHEGVASKPLSVEEAKAKQEMAQREEAIPEKTWNDYTTKELAVNMGKEAALAGLQGAVMAAGFTTISKYLDDGEVDGQVVAETAIKAGAKSGSTCAVAGALKVFVEKHKVLPASEGTIRNIVSLPWPRSLPPIIGSPVVIGMVASTTIDAACTAMKVAKGELTVSEGLLEVERGALSVVAGTVATVKGAAVGATLGAVLGPVGSAVGGFVGGTIAYIAGSTVGRAVATGVQKIREGTVNKVKTAWEGAKSAVSWVGEKVSSLMPWNW